MGFSRQEYWSGFPFPPPEVLSNPGLKSLSLVFPVLSGGFFTTGPTWEAPLNCELPLNIILLYGQGPDWYILLFIQVGNSYLLLGCKTF